jgi:periplasmic divalent cation tolerance protein
MVAYVACADLEQARRIGRTLVTEGLAACVNVHAHEAIYKWHGVVEAGPEATLLAKTSAECFPALRSRVRALHSYTVPCIVGWPIAEGDADYLAWMRAALQDARTLSLEQNDRKTFSWEKPRQ